MSSEKMREEFEAWYLKSITDTLGQDIRSAAQKNLHWTREDGSYGDPGLRLALMVWVDSRSDRWQPIETCPSHEEVLFFRADAGVFAGMITDPDHFMSDKERDEWEETEEEMFELDAFGYGDFGVCRCDGSERPTHWMQLPTEPEVDHEQ